MKKCDKKRKERREAMREGKSSAISLARAKLKRERKKEKKHITSGASVVKTKTSPLARKTPINLQED